MVTDRSQKEVHSRRNGRDGLESSTGSASAARVAHRLGELQSRRYDAVHVVVQTAATTDRPEKGGGEATPMTAVYAALARAMSRCTRTRTRRLAAD